MRTGTRVKTPNGLGTVKDVERFTKTIRYGVELDNNPFNFPIAYYFQTELEYDNERAKPNPTIQETQ